MLHINSYTFCVVFQSPPVPSLVGAGGAAEAEVSSASEETDEKEAEDEEMFCLRPMSGKCRHVEQGFSILTDP